MVILWANISFLISGLQLEISRYQDRDKLRHLFLRALRQLTEKTCPHTFAAYYLHLTCGYCLIPWPALFHFFLAKPCIWTQLVTLCWGAVMSLKLDGEHLKVKHLQHFIAKVKHTWGWRLLLLLDFIGNIVKNSEPESDRTGTQHFRLV